MKFAAFYTIRLLLAFEGAILIALGFISALRGAGLYWFYAGIMIVDAIVVLFLNYLLGGKKIWSYRLMFALLIAHIFLPILDQIGLADALFMAFNLFSLGALYLARKEFQ